MLGVEFLFMVTGYLLQTDLRNRYPNIATFWKEDTFSKLSFLVSVSNFGSFVDRFLQYTMYCNDLILIQMYQVEWRHSGLTSLSTVNSKKDRT